MRLGATAPVPSLDTATVPHVAKPLRKARRSCRDWERVAVRLGETFAGSELRRTVIDRICAFTLAGQSDSVWGWPWRDGGTEGRLPPVERARSGNWRVNCAPHAGSERCALVYDGVLSEAGETAAAAPVAPVRFSTHFVIDTVGGVEQLIWRVFVSGPAASRPGELARVVAFADRRAVVERFNACSAAGCLMEASLANSAEIAAQLHARQSVQFAVPAILRGEPDASGTIDADGWRKGLALLTTLRRREARTLAAGTALPDGR